MKENHIEINSYRNYLINAAVSDDCINGTINFYKPKSPHNNSILETEFGSLSKEYVNKVLKQFKLSSLEKNCKQCCIADLEEEEKDKKVVKLLPNVF